MQQFVYPRLGRSVALSLIQDVRRAARNEPASLASLVGAEHPLAAPVPTGGTLAPGDHVRHVRQAVLEAAAPFIGDDLKVPAQHLNAFDVAVGRALHETLSIVPADSAHEGSWSFLTLVVFPDLAYARFPDLPEQRLVGERRNVLRRAWQRVDVLGEWLWYGKQPLYEDEIVQITERLSLARNHRLARCMARAIVDHSHPGRTECSRQVAKEVVRQTGPLFLDSYDDDALEGFVQERLLLGHGRWEKQRAERRSEAGVVSANGAVPDPSDDLKVAAAEVALPTEADALSSRGDRAVAIKPEPTDENQGRADTATAPTDGIAQTTHETAVTDQVEDKYLRPLDEDLSPAWHPDPWGLARLRWWDGTQWTVHVAQ